MKKITLSLLILIFVAQKTFSNIQDSIPNSGFESWFTTTWFEFPAGWMTNNTQLLASTVVKDTDAYSGNLAMKLTNQGALIPQAWCDFSVANHPINFIGYMKDLLFPNDSAIIVVRLFLSQQLVDSGYLVVYGGINPGYTPFIIPISQNNINADSCQISFTGGNNFQSDISFDDLQFDYINSISVIRKISFSVYPNPCTDYIILEITDQLPISVELFNITSGKSEIPEIKNCETLFHSMRNLCSRKIIVDTKSLASGNWLIIVRKENQFQSALLIKN